MFLYIINLLRYGNIINGSDVIIRDSKFSNNVSLSSKVRVTQSTIGVNTQIYDYSVIHYLTSEGNNRIGKYCNCLGITLGRYSYVADSSTLIHLDIGRFCSIGSGVKIGLGNHPTNFISSNPYFYSSPGDEEIFVEHIRTTIGHDVWIGANVFVKDGVKIGNGAIIAAGAVVTRDVENYAIYGGVPAKLIRYRFDESTIKYLNGLNWWDKDPEWLKLNMKSFQKSIHTVNDLTTMKNI